MRIRVIEGHFAIARLPADSEIPTWDQTAFFSATRTPEELSIVVAESALPARVEAERDWSLLAVDGPIEFSEVGVLASLANPLARAGVSIFAISTYDTDYLLVRTLDLGRALGALGEAGHEVRRESRDGR